MVTAFRVRYPSGGTRWKESEAVGYVLAVAGVVLAVPQAVAADPRPAVLWIGVFLCIVGGLLIADSGAHEEE